MQPDDCSLWRFGFILVRLHTFPCFIILLPLVEIFYFLEPEHCSNLVLLKFRDLTRVYALPLDTDKRVAKAGGGAVTGWGGNGGKRGTAVISPQ